MSSQKKKISAEKFTRATVVLFFDVLVILLAYFAAMFIQADFEYTGITTFQRTAYATSMPFWVIQTVAVFFIFRLYDSLWSYVGVSELRNMIFAHLVLIPLYVLSAWLLKIQMSYMSPGYYIMGYVLGFFGTTAVRFAYRFLRTLTFFGRRSGDGKQENIMVVGAGSAARAIIREMKDSRSAQARVRCAIDDNPAKHGRLIEGVEIVGDRFDIIKAAGKFDITKIVFAIPSCSAVDRREILNICKETGCRLMILSNVDRLSEGETRTGQLRQVEITDLLGRQQLDVDNRALFAELKKKVVLVTGGGGSIGSELCRQVADAGVKQLIVFDIYENSAYEIQQELRRNHPELDIKVLIGSVRNTARIESVMQQYRPDLVFHAAAHKHVPLMEDSPCEAIKNNVFGTLKTAVAAEKAGVEKFVLVSTDKAVNPTNIMGASKRLCEMVVQAMDRKKSRTRFVAVRFGNVLGSNGSVIPLFKKQIEAGGPVTITDKRIIRYFMTITEAVSLVLQAAYSAKGGEIFVLDMGEPVKIDDMARNLIRLSGLRPDVDIKIEYVGLRPGEKLYEELLMAEEGMKETENKLIHIGKPIDMDDKKFMAQLKELEKAAKNEADDVRRLVSEMVPTYKYQE